LGSAPYKLFEAPPTRSAGRAAYLKLDLQITNKTLSCHYLEAKSESRGGQGGARTPEELGSAPYKLFEAPPTRSAGRAAYLKLDLQITTETLSCHYLEAKSESRGGQGGARTPEELGSAPYKPFEAPPTRSAGRAAYLKLDLQITTETLPLLSTSDRSKVVATS